MSNIFQKLNQGFILVVNGSICSGVGQHTLGACGLVFPDLQKGETYIKQISEFFDTLGQDIKLLPIEDSWNLMRRAAGEGLCAFESPEPESFGVRFVFMLRIEEAGNDLPTVLSAVEDKEIESSLTRTGVKSFNSSELLNWARFDILDSVLASDRLFYDWNQGEPLYEIQITNELPFMSEVSVIGDWIALDGAYPLFTTREQACKFIQNINDQKIGLFSFPDNPKFEENVVLLPNTDILARLKELRKLSPSPFTMAQFCINPMGHRRDIAYGRFYDFLNLDNNDRVYVYSVSGKWEILPNNHFQMIEPFSGWNGYDTIGWSGGQALQLTPLTRSFEFVNPDIIHASIDQLTESELEDELHNFLDGSSLFSFEQGYFGIIEPENNNLSNYYIIAWDTVTGAENNCFFNSIFEALAFLSAYEREHDSYYRNTGATGCSVLGFSGSNNLQKEAILSDKFKLGIFRIVKRIIYGYTPKDSNDLVTLCNATLRTLHIEYMGYAKDLLWSSEANEEQKNQILETLFLDKECWDKFYHSSEPYIDPEGESLCVERLGYDRWNLLSAKVKHFLSNALFHFKSWNNAPQFDYSPITIQMVKSLEFELGEIFKHISQEIGQSLPFDKNIEHEVAFNKFMEDDKKYPLLGQMLRLLRKPPIQPLPLRKKIYEEIAKLSNRDYLTEKHFLENIDNNILKKYRNPGAHREQISLETCLQCIEELLGTEKRVGIIPSVVEWKKRD
jgi:hypothetical protein